MPVRRSASIPRAGIRCLLAALALAFLTVACSGSGQQYVKSSDDRTYFKVPDGWKLYDEGSIIGGNKDLSDEQRDNILSTSWRTAFDASPEPNLHHLFSAATLYPTGLALVDHLSPDDADAVSDQVLRNDFLPVDNASDAGQLEMLSYERVNPGGGFHGIRFRARITSMADSEVYAEGPAFTFEQISLLNQARDKSYSLIVMCSSTCFEKHADRIEGV
ncbi:MAG TPA: hypothetical protein VFZ17_04735, partial [Acidimicrobiia bacterium]|nr:hypothetical protein [Acidimicrobiia bacterium]